MTDDRLERYSRGWLDAAEAAAVEEHLLDCQQCCMRLAPGDRTVVVLCRG